METITTSITLAQAAVAGLVSRPRDELDERGGSNSIENLIWIALAIALGAIVTAAIIAYVTGKLPS